MSVSCSYADSERAVDSAVSPFLCGDLQLTEKIEPELRRSLTGLAIHAILREWQDSLRVESVITKSTHFVALREHPRNSPHRAAWVSFFNLRFRLTAQAEAFSLSL